AGTGRLIVSRTDSARETIMVFLTWLRAQLPSGRRRRRRGTRRPAAPHFRPTLELLENRCLPSGGVLDPTFGSGGLVGTNVGALNDSYAYAVATYPNAGTANDGKVVAAGAAVNFKGGHGSDESFAVVRYNLDGSLDKTFAGSGQVTTNLSSAPDVAR